MNGADRLGLASRSAGAKPTTPLVALAGVHVVFPGRNGTAPLSVISGVDLALWRGEFLCVAGRSGSGKTTLLNVACGLRKPNQGEVWWNAIRLSVMDERARIRERSAFLGIVFQNAGLIGSLTAAENVALGALAKGSGEADRTRALALLAQVGLDARNDHFPAELSGGEQQRVGIARALYRDPPVLVVDEPTANLDRTSANEVIELLARLRDQGRALLVASHDAHVLDRADSILNLE